MGLWDEVRREVRKVLGGTQTAKPRARPFTPEELRGPEPGSLITADEIEAATGRRPVGEPDRKGGGSETDIGYFRVCEWMLDGGDELLINLTRIRDADALALLQSRRDWNDEEKPLHGLGDEAGFYVTRDPKGRSELHVSARKGMYKSNLVHSSTAERTDIGPLKTLMETVLSRLE